MRGTIWGVMVTVFVALLVVASCYQRTHPPACEDGGIGCEDGGGGEWCLYARIDGTPINRADILFVVDNTGSMGEEQSLLTKQAALMIRELIDPTDSGPEAPLAIDDLHVGVVSTDMGVLGHSLVTCEEPDGDDGQLQNQGRLEGCRETFSAPDCNRAECPWLVHTPEHPDDGSDPSDPPIWEDFACIATLGTGGCGLEQHLEASYRALIEQTAPGRPNEGFLRHDSIVLIVYVTDEDDCSTPNPDMFDPDRDDLGSLETRCMLNPGELYPVERYFEAFRALRPGDEDMVLVAGIAGIPIDGSWTPGDPIEELRELEQIDPENPDQRLPTCQTGMGLAFPPVRLVELISLFGENGVLASICLADWTTALESLTGTIQSRLTTDCLSDDLAATDLRSCRLIETLSDDRPCPHPADRADAGRTAGWQIDRGLDERGRRRCEILTADSDGDGCPDGTCLCDPPEPGYEGCLQGWFVRTEGTPCERGQIAITAPEVITEGGGAHFECRAESCP